MATSNYAIYATLYVGARVDFWLKDVFYIGVVRGFNALDDCISVSKSYPGKKTSEETFVVPGRDVRLRPDLLPDGAPQNAVTDTSETWVETTYATTRPTVKHITLAQAVFCSTCNVKAKYHNNQMPWPLEQDPLEPVLQPNLDGWMQIAYPFKHLHRGIGRREFDWLCPKCADDLKRYMSHKKTPMIDDEELLGE